MFLEHWTRWEIFGFTALLLSAISVALIILGIRKNQRDAKLPKSEQRKRLRDYNAQYDRRHDSTARIALYYANQEHRRG